MIELRVGTVQAELAAEIFRHAKDAFILESKACDHHADQSIPGDPLRTRLRLEASMLTRIASVLRVLEDNFRGVPLRPGALPVED